MPGNLIKTKANRADHIALGVRTFQSAPPTVSAVILRNSGGGWWHVIRLFHEIREQRVAGIITSAPVMMNIYADVGTLVQQRY